MTENEIYAMLEDCPAWDNSLAFELLQLAKNHLSVRAALMYSMQVAKGAELKLRAIETLEELKFQQGVIHGNEQYLMTLINSMAESQVLEVKTEEGFEDE